jgi:integrase
MASTWIVVRTTKSGERRFRVEYRQGGREAPILYGGSFKTKRHALERKNWIVGELANGRVPDLTWKEPPPPAPTFETAAKEWQAARVDVAASTRDQHRIQLAKLLPLIGTRRIDELTAKDFVDVVACLHADGVARETIRKTLGAGAMALDFAGIDPNPVRDRSIKLPREEPEQINPPTADHVAAVYRLLPSKHRLPLIWLDWSGARVSSIDLTLVSDYDEPRRRVRLRAATTKTRKPLWVELHPLLADELERKLGPREDRDPDARLFAGSGADAIRTAIGKACKAAGVPLWSPHDLRHRRISLLHLQGWPWVKIADFVGQKDLTVTANTYTHVLADEVELDYGKLLSGI